MAGRGRKRGRPPKVACTDRKQFDYSILKKPKYLTNASTSHASTPSCSRAPTPESLEGPSRNRRSSTSRGRGRGRKSITNSSRRGYESEYHYGSDFGDSSERSDQDDDLLLSAASEEESQDEEEPNLSEESDFSVGSFTQMGRPPRPPSPDPIWLQDRSFCDLILPESSDDLLLSKQYVLDALSIYEVVRRFRNFARMSPFRFEDFCAALACEEQSTLLVETHIMLLKAILRFEDVQGTHFGPLDQKDSTNISLYLIDAITWPEVLRSYVECDQSFDREVYAILCAGEYPFVCVSERLKVLKFLTDHFLTSNTVRATMAQEAPMLYDDHCRVCHRTGNLLCCETCPATYHLECVDPPLEDIPTEDWQCVLCKQHKLEGVTDCLLPQEKKSPLIRHEYLGLDRHGRKYWFIARRLFVEDLDGNAVSYYSTSIKLELLLDSLDAADLESGLCMQIQERQEEIERQMLLTESITNDLKQHKKSYIEHETEQITMEGVSDTEDKAESGKILTRNKLNQINNNTFYFKLGMDQAFKTYVNHYASNPLALNKPQRNEERDKRRHLSHKFSLTTASEFKWIGVTMGSSEQVAYALRQTMLNFESNVPAPFFISIWSQLKRIWTAAVGQARTPADFSVVLQLFQASLKNVLYANVWHEHLGHLQLKRITSLEREERKKLEKREKREREDEEERLRVCNNFVKYSLGVKHQVWKQKGEEYRQHGKGGWMWMSANRRSQQIKAPASLPILGQTMLPGRLQLHYQQGEEVNEIISVHPRTQIFMQQIMQSQAEGHHYRYTDTYEGMKILKTPTDQQLKEYMAVNNKHIDVSKALQAPGRLLYPKVARQGRLDNLLNIRLKLQQSEEKWKPGMQESEKQNNSVANIKHDQSQLGRRQTYLEKRLLYIVEINYKSTNFPPFPSPNVNYDLVNCLAKKIQNVRIQFSHLNRFCKQSQCYTKACNTNSNAVAQISQNTCYSPLCLQKGRAKKELLYLLRRAHNAGHGSKETVSAILGAVKRPSILEQKLTEGKRVDLSLNATLNAACCSDVENIKQQEEAPLDLLNDLEQAHAAAVAYTDSLWQNCFMELMEEEDEQKVKEEEAVKMEVEETFMDDNLDVCDTVEIESSNNNNNDNNNDEDDLTAQLTAAAVNAALPEVSNDSEFGSRRQRRAKSLRSKSFSEKEQAAVPQSFVAETTTAVNTHICRRFGTFARKNNNKREKEYKVEKEYLPDGRERVYTRSNTSERIYLYADLEKWREHVAKGKQAAAAVKGIPYIDKVVCEKRSRYPLISHFLTHRQKKSPLILARHELVKLARVAGKIPVNGYHHFAKVNNNIWPYPCSRPLFKTCWAFRTCNAHSLAEVALQLRILWSCLRWDDMIVKPQTTDGKHTITTDTEVVTTELLKIRHMGRYGEKTQYLRKRTTIPLEMPKNFREVAPIRSGLRKRKRAESPQPTEPQISEEWVEEEKLELWEIKYIYERLERVKLQATTRAASLRQSQSNNSMDGSAVSVEKSGSNSPLPKTPLNIAVKPSEDIKLKLDDQIKQQRIVYRKNGNEETPNRITVSTSAENKPYTLPTGRRIIVKAADGTTRVIQQGVVNNNNGNTTSPAPTNESSQVYSSNTNTNTVSGSSTSTPQHKVQIIRGPDGRVSVRGLNPGQQLIQMPDGKLHVLTASPTTVAASKVMRNVNVKPIPVSNVGNSPVVGVKPLAVKAVSKDAAQVTKYVMPMKGQNFNNGTNNTVTSGNNSVNNIVLSSTGTSTNVLHNLDDNNRTVLVQPTKLTGTHNVILSKTINQSQQQQQQQQHISTINIPTMNNMTMEGNNNNNNITSTSSTINNGSSGQKVIQQIVNTSNVQQQIMVGGQRIILSPGQTIVTQRSVLPTTTSVSGGGVQQTQQIQQQPQQQQVQIVANATKQIVMPQHVQQQQQQQTTTVIQQQQQQQQATNMPQHHQLIVQNSAMAQQLAQGKLQVANINGQQVIIKPLGNNQAQIVAHVKTQTDGNSHIITNTALMDVSTQMQAVSSVSGVGNKNVSNNNNNNETTTTSGDLPTKQQQQQQNVYQQQTTSNISNNYNNNNNNVSAVTTQTTTTTSTTTTTNSSLGISAEESTRLLQGQPPGTVIKCVTAQVIQTEQGPRIVLQGLVGNDFNQQQLALVQQQVKQQLLKAQASSGKQGVLGPTKLWLAVQPSVSSTILNSQPPPLTPVQQPTLAVMQQSAQQQQNSSLERMSNIIANDAKDDDSTDMTTTINNDLSIDDSSSAITPNSINGDNLVENENENVDIMREIEVLQQQYDEQKQQQQQQHPLTAVGPQQQLQTFNTSGSPAGFKKRIFKSGNIVKRRDNLNSCLTGAEISEFVEDGNGNSNEVNPTLEQHKNELKRNILRKRSILERNIRMKISDEVNTPSILLSGADNTGSNDSMVLQDAGIDDRENIIADSRLSKFCSSDNLTASTPIHKGPSKPSAQFTHFNTNKPRGGVGKAVTNKPKKPTTTTNIRRLNEERPTCSSVNVRGAMGRSRKTSSSSNNKKEKLYCVCKTPYDDTKFYVGCDICSNWFHGDCVNITEEASKKLTEFICADCKLSREPQQLYCLCRQPYDESQFYICCDKCQGWFHGRCVGIVQTEAIFIDEYICPDCQTNDTTNKANMKNLTEEEKDDLRKLIKVVKSHKSAWPFKYPVDPKEAPDYYNIIKEPMDLQTIEAKINEHQYTKLSQFIGDMTKMFDNCRYYNEKASAFFKCAESLEAFFVQKIKEFRRNVVSHN